MELQGKRLVSLDVGRGITIMGMLIANNQGNWNHVYSQLQHAQWNGLHIADLGIPTFLFIVGMALTFSLEKRFKRGASKADIYKKAVTRASLLFLIGLFVEAFPFIAFNPLRIEIMPIQYLGVLQSIALSYLFATILYLEFKKWYKVLLLGVGLLAAYWYLLTQIPVSVPGTAAAESSNIFSYVYNTLSGNYDSIHYWEKVKLLGLIPGTAAVLFGTVAGLVLRFNKPQIVKCALFFTGGVIALALGLLFHSYFPINKKILSSSYIVCTIGIALIIFSLLYWIIEMRKWNWWTTPFKAFGKNALLVFIGSVMLSKLIALISFPEGWGSGTFQEIMYYNYLLPISNPTTASFIYAFLIMSFWLAVMWVLKKQKIFVKV